MADFELFPEMEDDLNIITALGDNPNAENGLTADGLKMKFDEAGLKLQKHLNRLIKVFNERLGTAVDLISGGTLLASLNVNAQKLFGLKTPTEDDEAAPAGYVKAKVNKVMEAVNKKAETAAYVGTLPASGWSSSAPYTQTVDVDGILGSDTPFVDVNLSGVADGTSILEAWSCVGRVSASEDGKITAYCYQLCPAVDIPLIFKVVR